MTIDRIILRGTTDLVGQAAAAAYALAVPIEAQADHWGVRCNGKYYGISRGKSSLTVWPQPEAPPLHKNERE